MDWTRRAVSKWLPLLVAVTACDEAGSPESLSDPPPLFTLQDDADFAPEPFTQVTGATWMEDGTLIVGDMVEGGLVPIDREGVRGEPFGSEGEGPGEFVHISDVVSVAADTFAVVDGLQRRLILFTTAGEPLSQFTFPGELRMGPRHIAGRRLLARASLAPGGEEAGYQVPLVAWNWEDNQLDTITTLRHRPMHLVLAGTDTPFEVFEEEPYALADGWVATQAERIVVARARPYRMEWFDFHGSRTGPELDHHPVPISVDEREEFQARVPVSEGWDWPEAKPPFRPSGLVAATVGNEVWVRSWEVGAEGEWYDRISEEGNRIGRVAIPEGRRLLVASDSEVFTVKEDELGFQWVRRSVLVPLTLETAGR